MNSTARFRLPSLLKASHPEPSAAVTLMALALAIATGRSATGLWMVALAVLTGQLSIGWSNDYIDRHRDAQTARRDKPIAEKQVSGTIVWAAAWVSLICCVPLSLASGWKAGLTHVAAVALGWWYNLALKATAFSVVPYALAFALLPAFVVLGLPTSPLPPWWLVVTGGLLGAGAHFANTLPDFASDELTGIRGLPHRIGPTASRVVSAVLLVGASLVVTLGPSATLSFYSAACLGAIVVLLAMGTLTPQVFGARGAFRASIGVAAIDVVLFIASAHSLR